MPGASEFVAAIFGAIVGALSSGIISWLLQRSAFKDDQANRSKDKKVHERALLLQALYACLQASDDLSKFADTVRKAQAKLARTPAPPAPGISSNWLTLPAHMFQPEAIKIDPAALTAMVDHKQTELLKKVIHLAAAHNAALKLWASYASTSRRLGEKISVKIADDGRTYFTLTQAEQERHYAHIKELSDTADAICRDAEKYERDSREATMELLEFMRRTMDEKVSITWPNQDNT